MIICLAHFWLAAAPFGTSLPNCQISKLGPVNFHMYTLSKVISPSLIETWPLLGSEARAGLHGKRQTINFAGVGRLFRNLAPPARAIRFCPLVYGAERATSGWCRPPRQSCRHGSA